MKNMEHNSSVTYNQSLMDISYYKLDLFIDVEIETITGSVTIKGIVGSLQPEFLEFDFSNQMTVDSIKLQQNVVSFEHENSLIKIASPDVIGQDGYEFEIEIFYNGNPTPTGFGSFNFDSHNNIPHVWTLSEPFGSRSWWPCKDDPADKADSVDIIITMREDQIVVSNGILVEETEVDNGFKRYFWKETYPITTYLVSITTYPYEMWTNEYVSVNGDTMPIVHYVYPDHYDIVFQNYQLTASMMSLFENRFGEYPFINEKYGHVEFGRGGGMEHQTISSMGGYSQWLIAHELGHQWWGNLVTCNSFEHIWLNEGFARFSEALWEEEYNGFEAYKSYWVNHAYYGPGTVYVENTSNVSEIFNLNLTYNKAGWVVHMLRGVMGDSSFFQTLKSYGSNDTLAYNSATTEDFKKVCEAESGLDLEDFFNQWIYGSYYPKYGVSWELNEDNELIVDIYQQQSWQYFNMPIPIHVITTQDTIKLVLENTSEYQQFNLGFFSNSVVDLKFDPDNWILKEVEYLSLPDIVPEQSDIILYPAYPNPFNSSTFISFYIPENLGQINSYIKVYDIKGKLIDDMSYSKSIPGLNKILWDSKNIASGIYFIQLNAGRYSYDQKVQLIK